MDCSVSLSCAHAAGNRKHTVPRHPSERPIRCKISLPFRVKELIEQKMLLTKKTLPRVPNKSKTLRNPSLQPVCNFRCQRSGSQDNDGEFRHPEGRFQQKTPCKSGRVHFFVGHRIFIDNLRRTTYCCRVEVLLPSQTNMAPLRSWTPLFAATERLDDATDGFCEWAFGAELD